MKKTEEKMVIIDQEGNPTTAMIPAEQPGAIAKNDWQEDFAADFIRPEFIRWAVDIDSGEFVNSANEYERASELNLAPWGVRHSRTLFFPFGKSELVWKCRCDNRKSGIAMLNEKMPTEAQAKLIATGAGKNCYNCGYIYQDGEVWRRDEYGKYSPPECTDIITIAFFDLDRGIPCSIAFKKTSYNNGEVILQKFARRIPGTEPPPPWSFHMKATTKEIDDERGHWFIPVARIVGQTEDYPGCQGLVEDIQKARQHYTQFLNKAVIEVATEKAREYETGDLDIEDIG